MAPATPRLRILSVGGNSVSAFLSWRLQSTNACDVTLVWKQDHDYVSQYGITWTSNNGKEKARFKPHSTVKAPEEASHNAKTPFDYVLLCIKALPDVYDMASVIESVVAPQHTCILLNTTSSIGVEQYLEERFPSNVLLSLVCGADLVQTGPTDFEHRGDCSDIFVGWANKNPAIPASIQKDMAEALAMTLSTGGVACSVSENIRQQQFERMIGPIAFHPASVLFDCPTHADLLEKVGGRSLILGVIEELMQLAKAHGCTFSDDFVQKTLEEMIKPTEKPGFMYADFTAKRPMEVETYLGSPIRLSKEVNTYLPRVETLYALLHHKNTINLQTPAAPPAPAAAPNSPPPMQASLPPRSSSVAGHAPRPMMNGSMPNGGARRAPSSNGPNGPMGPNMRRPPPPHGYGPRMPIGHGPGMPPNGSMMQNRRPSFDGNDLQEFSHLMLYDAAPEGAFPDGMNGDYADNMMGPNDIALKERELALRARELELRERQMNMRQRRPPPSQAGGFDDDEDDDFFDPMEQRGPAMVDDNFDMMSVTSRRNRKAPSHNMGRGGPPGSGGRGFSFGNRNNMNRSSSRMMQDVPNLHESIMSNPLLGYSSNRYGNVDRQTMGQESRQNSLTQARLDELQRGGGGGPYGGYPPMQRRTSQSPGMLLDVPNAPPSKRPSPPNGFNGYAPPRGPMPPRGRPSPPNGMRQPMPRHPPGLTTALAPEQYAGVSMPPTTSQKVQVRSLTGSASASAGSGDSGHLESDPSANSSQSSLPAGMGTRLRMGVTG